MERVYETMIVLRPDLEEDVFEETCNKILNKIKTLGGKILDSKIWAKGRKFCYPIRSRGAEKKKFDRGDYWLVNFILDTEKLPDLKETIRLEENILRNLIVRKENKNG